MYYQLNYLINFIVTMRYYHEVIILQRWRRLTFLNVLESEYVEYEYTGSYWNIHCPMSQPVPSKIMALHHNAYLQKSLKWSMPGIDGMICLNFKSSFVIDTYQETTPSSGERFPIAIIVANNGRDKSSLSALHCRVHCMPTFRLLFWSMFHLTERS